MLNFNKRGIDSVVSNVLFILLVIILGIIVFTWSRNYMVEAQKKAEVQKACESIEFISGQYCYNIFYVESLETRYSEGMHNLVFDVRNNAIYSHVYGFTFVVYSDGNSFSIPSLYGSEIESGNSKKIFSAFIEGYPGSENIEIIPVYNLNGKLFSCKDKSVTIKTLEVSQC